MRTKVIATRNGGDTVPFTAKEEAARDAEEALVVAAAPARALAELRKERDILLRGSDFTQLADTPGTGTEKASWAAYRQKLRDLPASTIDPARPVWPVEPI